MGLGKFLKVIHQSFSMLAVTLAINAGFSFFSSSSDVADLKPVFPPVVYLGPLNGLVVISVFDNLLDLL